MKAQLKFQWLIIIFFFSAQVTYAQLQPTDLDYNTLKQEFNALLDKPVILSILGVNCPPCRTHRDDIRNQIFNQCDNPDLNWIVIWFEDPGHPALRNDAVNQANLTTDTRVKQWWYEEHQSTTSKNDSICYDFGKASWLSCLYPWDISMIFDSGIEWTGVDPPNPSYCMAKIASCCNSFSIVNFKTQVDNLDICDASIPSGIHNHSLNESVKIYPVPVRDELNVDLNGIMDFSSLTIYNNKGQLVYKKDRLETRTAILKIDVKSWVNGIYYMNIESQTGIISKRMVISK